MTPGLCELRTGPTTVWHPQPGSCVFTQLPGRPCGYQDFTQEAVLRSRETQSQGQAGDREAWVIEVGSCGQTVQVLKKKVSRVLGERFLLENGA